MNDLEQQLREMDLSGPPLGFDPDDLAVKAAKLARGRRAMGAAVLATAAVAFSAVVLVASGSPAYLPPAGQGSSGNRSPSSILPPRLSTVLSGTPGPATAAPSTTLSGDRLQQIRTRLLNALTKAAPGVSKVTIDALGDSHSLTATVRYTDPAGHQGKFSLDLADKADRPQAVPLAAMCLPDRPTGPDGKPLRCDKITQPDGSVLVLSESGLMTPGDFTIMAKLAGLSAVLFRADGSVSGVSTFDSPNLPEQTSLTDQQLAKLITDPGLTLP